MTEEDNGRFKQTKAERDRHRFKVPGLRNIELTAPYFHDGSMATMMMRFAPWPISVRHRPATTGSR